MKFSSRSALSFFRIITLMSLLAFVVSSSPILPNTVHHLAHDRGITHTHGVGGTEHSHEHSPTKSDQPAFGKLHVELHQTSAFLSPLKTLTVVSVVPEATIIAPVSSGILLVPFSGAPPDPHVLEALLVSHLNKAPPFA